MPFLILHLGIRDGEGKGGGSGEGVSYALTPEESGLGEWGPASADVCRVGINAPFPTAKPPPSLAPS